MTINEALKQTQGRGAGLVNGASVRYAQSLLQPGESVTAAVIANITTRIRHESFPGVVVLTDQRVIAACGLPGIKRQVSLPIQELEKCEESNSVITYNVTFYTEKDGFKMTLDPDTGEALSPYIAEINGEEFEDIKLELSGTSRLFNPTMIRQQRRGKLRKQRNKEREAARNIQRQQDAAARYDAVEEEDVPPAHSPEPAPTPSEQPLDPTDPRAVAARLAAELAQAGLYQEESPSKGEDEE